MKIQVRLSDGESLTYNAPPTVQVGDDVLVPSNRWRERQWASVIALDSPYEGYLVDVIAVRRTVPR